MLFLKDKILRIESINGSVIKFRVILKDSRTLIVDKWCQRCKIPYAVGFHQHTYSGLLKLPGTFYGACLST